MARTHWVDRAYGALTSATRLFSQGFGDLERLRPLREAFLAPAAPEAIDVNLEPERSLGKVRRRQGYFLSPSASWLPVESHIARFELLLPATQDPPVCVYLAATGEQGFALRRRMCLPLVMGGLGALLLEAPFYGVRRPPTQRSWALGTVADQLAMALATIEETRSLLGWLQARGHAQVGVTGYSMGGSMAAYVAARSPFPLSVAPLAAGDSSGPIFTRGMLSRRVDWKALAPDGDEEAARHTLLEIFDSVGLLKLPAPADCAKAVIVGCRDDAFVEFDSVQRLFHHWKGSELRWLEGGHVTGLVSRAGALRAAIRDAFHREPPPAAGRS